MFEPLSSPASRSAAPAILRVGLFLIAASLALYIPYKYAFQPHAITGLYAFAFPFSGLLALGGMALAIKPEAACDCSGSMRAGFGLIAALWMVVGLRCIPSLAEMVQESPLRGGFATFQMTAQHIVLSLAVLAFAIAPGQTARLFGGSRPAGANRHVGLGSAEATGLTAESSA